MHLGIQAVHLGIQAEHSGLELGHLEFKWCAQSWTQKMRLGIQVVHLVIQVLRPLRNCQSRSFVETHDPGLGSLMFRCSQAFVAWPDTLDRPWKPATRQELIIFVDPRPLRGYFLRAHFGPESRGYSWLFFSGWLWPWIGVAIFGYPWLFFWAVAIFLAAGIFAVFSWLFF